MLLDLIQPNIDRYGLIAQTDGDGGDSLQREGMFMHGVWQLMHAGEISFAEYLAARSRFQTNMSALELDGKLRRHVDTDRWYSAWDRCSRDQYHSVIAIGLTANCQMLSRVLSRRAKSFFLFTTNTAGNTDTPKWKLPDITGPGTWAMEIRAALHNNLPGSPLLAILLPVLDISLVVDSLIWRYNFKHNQKNVDILNHLQCLAQASVTAPNFVVKFAKKLLNPDKIKSCLQTYFSVESNGVTGMVPIWSDVVDLLWR